MAQPTTPHPQPAQPQQPTAGVMAGAPHAGAQPQTKDTKPAEPVLFDDIDPVLLVRLYPHAKSGDDGRHKATEAGHHAYEAAMHLVASQQEPLAPPAPPPA